MDEYEGNQWEDGMKSLKKSMLSELMCSYGFDVSDFANSFHYNDGSEIFVIVLH